MASLYEIAVGILLALLASPATVLTQEFACYESTDCHGVTVESLPQRGECCAGRGLSFTLEGETHCRNCFSVEEFMSEGSEFYLAFFDNLDIGEFLTRARIAVRVNNMEQIPQNVTISYESKIEEMEVDSGGSVDFDLPVDIRLKDIGEMDNGITIQSVDGATLSVTAFGNEVTSSDTYQLLPCVYLPSMYEYYAVSVQLENNTVVEDGEVITPDPSGDSVLVVVASEDNTQVTITPTQDVFIVPDKETLAGTPESLTLNRRQTLFVSSVDDLTGTHVVSNKPVSVFSGHECGTVPYDVPYCDHLVEQIPPTATWGKEFYTVSFMSRPQDIFKAITLKDGNTIRSECTDVNGTLIDSVTEFPPGAGEVVEFTLQSDQFCRFTSDFPILLVQFSIGGSADGQVFADPFMTIIPPVRQYRRSYMLNYFSSLRNSNFLNIILLNTNGATTGDTLLNGERIDSSIIWTEIQCESGVCAYGIQLEVGEGSDTITLSHVNEEAQLVGIPYSMGLRTGSGTFSGMSQKPIALDTVTLNRLGYSGNEGSEVVTITVTRSGDLLDNTTVPFRAHAIPDATNAAIPGEDFMEVEMDIFFPPQVASVDVEVPLGLDDIFPGEDKVFEVYLGPSPGVFVSPTAYTNVTIIDPDPLLPVMNVSFRETSLSVSEGGGFFELTLVKTEGAVGPVTVNLITIPGPGSEDILHFEPLEVNITFEVPETEKVVQILITNDDVLERDEELQVMIAPVEGLFPVEVIDSVVAVNIADNDRVVIGFQRGSVSVNEPDGEVPVTITILNGVSLARNVNVQLISEDGSARQGDDYSQVNRNLNFSASTTSMMVLVTIINDFNAEERERFFLSLMTEDPAVATAAPLEVVITDDDDVRVSLRTVDRVRSVPENALEIDVLVAVNASDLVGIFEVGLSTIPITAEAGVDFEILTNHELTFVATGMQVMPIEIYNNDESDGEMPKMFRVTLSLLESSFDRVNLVTDSIDITIIDDEEPPTADTVCHLSGSDFPRVQSAHECCVLNNGSAYESSNFTIPCIVIGFEQDSYTMQEQEDPYSLNVRLLQGSLSQNITVTVISTPGTAAPSDYSVSPWVNLGENVSGVVSVRLFLEQEVGDSALETFRLDLIEESMITPHNVFFRGAEITIEDSFMEGDT